LNLKGFTLLEVVIVVIIVGVLATLALAGMFDVIERSRIAEAMAMAQTIRSAMERYALMNNGSYNGVSIGMHNGDHCGDDWSLLAIENPSCTANSHFDYGVSGGLTFFGKKGFLIVCTRNGRDQSGPSQDGRILINYEETNPIITTGWTPGTIKICGQGYYSAVYGPCS
jgi:prepilin-type N-terminal cleavage/methylation domain-containing protein